jgi:predicted amidohydrolase
LVEIAAASADLGCLAVVGLPLAVEGRLYNVAAVIGDGRVLGYVPKSFLPNSGEFYERRWFSPAATLRATEVAGVPIGVDLLFEVAELPNFVVGVEICEDLWTVVPPSSLAALAGATILVNPSASNEVLGKVQYRRNLVTQQSARCLAAYVYASAGAGESSTDTVYSGHGLVAENGALLGETERFSFATRDVVVDVDLQRLAHERLKSAAFRDDETRPDYRKVSVTLGVTPGLKAGLLRQVSAHPFVPPAGADRRAVCEEIFAIQATALARRLRALGGGLPPVHVVLPLSPNHGQMGRDGLYAEAKAALEALMQRWAAEHDRWGAELSLVGARIGWVRGTGLMAALDGVYGAVVGQDGYLDSLTMLVAFLLVGRLLEQRGRRHAVEADAWTRSRLPLRHRH